VVPAILSPVICNRLPIKLFQYRLRFPVCSRLAPSPVFAYLEAMEVHFAPELQARIDQLLTETGYSPDQLVADAMAGYVAELAETRQMLDSRYDDLKSGRVKPIDGE
jgi:hypothetical protein